ncbi:MAG: O-antigen ligase family protein [Chloroflexota bacterium]|nr:MAG: O-antigen ligase family protein [Chloroflexota bacterium]
MAENLARLFPVGLSDRGMSGSKLLLFCVAMVAIGAGVALDARVSLVPVGLVALALLLLVSVPRLVILMAFLLPIQGYFFLPGTNFTLRLAYILAAAALLRALWAQRGQVQRRLSLHHVPPLLFFACLAVSTVGARDVYLALKGMLEWGALFVTFYAVVYGIQEMGQLWKVVWALIAGMAFQGSLGLVQFMGGIGFQQALLSSRLSGILFQPTALQSKLAADNANWVFMGTILPFGTFLNNIDYSVFMAMGLSFIVGLLLGGSRVINRHVLMVVMFVASAAVALAAKGTGWNAAIAGVAVVWILSGSKLRWAVWPVALISPLAIVQPAIPVVDLLRERLYSLAGQTVSSTSSVLGRLDIWQHYLGVFADRWMLGYGPYNSILYGSSWTTWQNGMPTATVQPTESGYLAVLVDTGVLGFAAFALVVVWLLAAVPAGFRGRLGRGSTALWLGAVGAVVAFLVGNISVAGLTSHQNVMVFAICAGILHLLKHWAQAPVTRALDQPNSMFSVQS